MSKKIFRLVDKKKKTVVIETIRSDCETMRGALLATQPERKKDLVIEEVNNDS